MPKEIDDLWQKGIEYAKDCGAEIIDISLPHTNYALPTYYIVDQLDQEKMQKQLFRILNNYHKLVLNPLYL